MKVLVAQGSLTLFDPLGCGLPDSSVCGISQGRTLEWVAILFSRGSFQPRDQIGVSCTAVSLLTLWRKHINTYIVWKTQMKTQNWITPTQLIEIILITSKLIFSWINFSFYNGQKFIYAMLERVWRKGDPLTLLVGMQTSTAAMENSVEIP